MVLTELICPIDGNKLDHQTIKVNISYTGENPLIYYRCPGCNREYDPNKDLIEQAKEKLGLTKQIYQNNLKILRRYALDLKLGKKKGLI